MPGLQKLMINVILLVAFLLEQMNVKQINETLREALDSQLMEIIMKDVKKKIDEHVKTTKECLGRMALPPPGAAKEDWKIISLTLVRYDITT